MILRDEKAVLNALHIMQTHLTSQLYEAGF